MPTKRQRIKEIVLEYEAGVYNDSASAANRIADVLNDAPASDVCWFLIALADYFQLPIKE